MSKQQSGTCAHAPPNQCNCHGLGSNGPEGKMLQDGCWLFKKWGWTTGVPKMDWKPVECPQRFVEFVRIGNAFSADGVVPPKASRNHGDLSAALKSTGWVWFLLALFAIAVAFVVFFLVK